MMIYFEYLRVITQTYYLLYYLDIKYTSYCVFFEKISTLIRVKNKHCVSGSNTVKCRVLCNYYKIFISLY